MDSVGSELSFDGTVRLVEIKFGGCEKFGPNGLSLVHNVFYPSILTCSVRILVIIKILVQMA